MRRVRWPQLVRTLVASVVKRGPTGGPETIADDTGPANLRNVPLTYRLDELGWFEFEKLVQALLKLKLGFGVEAWGGSGDWGRDAYFAGALHYPSTKLEEGAFVFQCKFVEDANSAGANGDTLILAAIYKERTRIKERLQNGEWPRIPKHYGLFTNAELSPELRKKIQGILADVLPEEGIHQHDGEDVCGWLRNAPDLVRTCPQLLSLRDLDALLADVVNAATITRSEAAVTMAKSQARIFVPTAAYYRARQTLQSHNFVVLEGPPEMGKTTIGRVVALSQL